MSGVELFVLEGNQIEYEIVAVSGDFTPSSELNGEAYGDLSIDTIYIEKRDLHGNTTEYKIALNPEHELYGFKMPKVKVKAPKFKAPKMKVKVNTKGLSKGVSSIGKSVSSAGKAYGKAWSSVGKGLGKGLSSIGKSAGSLLDQLGQDGGDEQDEEDQTGEDQTDDDESEDEESENANSSNEELNGFLSMIGAAAGSVIAPGIGTGIGASLGSMVEKKKKPKKKKQSKPQQSQSFQRRQPEISDSYDRPINSQYAQQINQYANQGNAWYNKISRQGQQLANQERNFNPSFLRENSDGSLAMGFDESSSNLWELDGELGGLFGPSEQEIYQYMYMSAAAGAAATYLLLVLFKKKRKKKV